jgi:purine-cytosine permease-like protein
LTNNPQAYWLAIYEGVSLPEHIIFRKGTTGYAPETYDVPKKLPPSLAAMGAFCFGIFGAVMGMAQVWFIVSIIFKCHHLTSSLTNLTGTNRRQSWRSIWR